MRKWLRPILLLPALYLCWLAMMAVHEAGHVLHAWLTGGTVSAVRVPLLGFSVTEFSMNPRPHFVTWGGPTWGCVLPLLLYAAWRATRLPGMAWVQFFAGFCLVANGAYLGVGWLTGAGDAGDLVAYGTPVWVLVVFGLVTGGAGLFLWHLLGLEHRPSPPSLQPRSGERM
jgi:hypothetical protein